MLPDHDTLQHKQCPFLPLNLHSLSCYQIFCAAPNFSPPWDELMTNPLLCEAESTGYLTTTTSNY